MRRLTLVLLLAAGASAGCGPASVRPLAFPDPAVPCPAGRLSWSLEVLDRRADTEGGDKMIASIRDGVEKSFPGCRWSGPATGNSQITITVHRFAVAEHDNYQNAAAEWTVNASNESGRTITEFDANEEDTRPAYPGADDEALNEVFRKALQRTVQGLSVIQQIGSIRHPQGTSEAAARPEPEGASAPVTR